MWRSAQQIIEDVYDRGNVAFRPTVAILQCRIQGARKRARVDAFAVVLHRFDDRTGA